MRYLSFLSFFLLFLVACGPQVKFVQPQPKGGKNLSRLPRELYGRYIEMNDSSLLEIDSFRVVKRWFSEKIIPRDSIKEIEKDFEILIQRDTQIYVSEKRDNWLSSGLRLDVKFLDDSVRVSVNAENIMFEVSDSQLVRKYRGYCLLNTRTKEGLWLIKVFTLKGSNLHFDDLLDADQVKNLKRITRVDGPVDSVKKQPTEFYLNPTRRELRRILRTRNSEPNFTKVN